MADIIPDPDWEKVFDDVDSAVTIAFLERHIDTLPFRTAFAIRLYYGMESEGEFNTLENVGEILGVTRERARQIIAQGIGRLQKRILKERKKIV